MNKYIPTSIFYVNMDPIHINCPTKLEIYQVLPKQLEKVCSVIKIFVNIWNYEISASTAWNNTMFYIWVAYLKSNHRLNFCVHCTLKSAAMKFFVSTIFVIFRSRPLSHKN